MPLRTFSGALNCTSSQVVLGSDAFSPYNTKKLGGAARKIGIRSLSSDSLSDAGSQIMSPSNAKERNLAPGRFAAERPQSQWSFNKAPVPQAKPSKKPLNLEKQGSKLVFGDDKDGVRPIPSHSPKKEFVPKMKPRARYRVAMESRGDLYGDESSSPIPNKRFTPPPFHARSDPPLRRSNTSEKQFFALGDQFYTTEKRYPTPIMERRPPPLRTSNDATSIW